MAAASATAGSAAPVSRRTRLGEWHANAAAVAEALAAGLRRGPIESDEMALSPKRIDGLWVAATAASIGCVTLIGACSTPDTSPPRSWLLYALGVAIGECPPDIAFYHAAPLGARTLLGVVVSPMQVISYTVSSKDPECDGVTASATVPDHANGHSTCTAIPL